MTAAWQYSVRTPQVCKRLAEGGACGRQTEATGQCLSISSAGACLLTGQTCECPSQLQFAANYTPPDGHKVVPTCRKRPSLKLLRRTNRPKQFRTAALIRCSTLYITHRGSGAHIMFILQTFAILWKNQPINKKLDHKPTAHLTWNN